MTAPRRSSTSNVGFTDIDPKIARLGDQNRSSLAQRDETSVEVTVSTGNEPARSFPLVLNVNLGRQVREVRLASVSMLDGTEVQGSSGSLWPGNLTPLQLENSWTGFGGAPALYDPTPSWMTISEVGEVSCQGLIKRASLPAAASTIWRFPAGMRPDRRLIFGCIDGTNAAVRLDVLGPLDGSTEHGKVLWFGASANFLTINAIRFKAIGDPKVPLARPMTVSWTPKGGAATVRYISGLLPNRSHRIRFILS